MTKGGKLIYLDKAKFELDDVLKKQTGIDGAITASLSWLKTKHPEMFKNKRAVKELIDYVLDNPNIIKDGKSENTTHLAKIDGKKTKDIVISKNNKEIIHANNRKMTSSEKSIKRASEDALHSHTDTKPAGALKLEQNARLVRTNEIIPQNSVKELADKISKINDRKKLEEIGVKTIKDKILIPKDKASILNAVIRRISILAGREEANE